MKKVIIGQEAICPGGLGRVVDFEIKDKKINVIIVEEYIGGRRARWNHKAVELIDPRPLALDRSFYNDP